MRQVYEQVVTTTPRTLDGVEDCGGRVEVERVAEFVRAWRTAGLDARGQIAGVMAA